MREALALNGPTILKTLPLYCKEFKGYEPGMFPGNHESSYQWCLDILNKVSPFWNCAMQDVYSHAALHFAATQYPDYSIDFLKFLKKSNCYIFIGNKNIPKDIIETLFGPNCIFMPTPSEQSYNDIDRIENECLEKIDKNSDYKVIITAMGCSGRILQKRLWQKLGNVFLFDFGSLMDALCGWNTRAWIELTKFDADKFIANLTREVKILYTAALLDCDYELRKLEYIKSLDILKNYGYSNPYIVEAIKSANPTFLDNYSCNVMYSNVNDYSLRNKGINEARSIIEAFKQFNFNDKDMIIKITGRYFFTSDQFLKLVENNPSIDAFIKTDGLGQVFTGCFALRYKYFKTMLGQLDYDKMEHSMINIEQEVAIYINKIIKEQNANVMYCDKLDMLANIGNSKPHQPTYW